MVRSPMCRLVAPFASFILVFFIGLAVATAAVPPLSPTLRLPFVENGGQGDAPWRFLARTSTGSVAVTADGAIVHGLRSARDGRIVTAPLTEKLEGASPRVTGGERAATRVSSMIGKDRSRWVENQSSWNTVSLGEAWPKITVTLAAHRSSVEKLFTLAPGADPGLIRLALGGSRGLEKRADGTLAVTMDGGTAVFSRPVAYQVIDGVRLDVAVAYAPLEQGYGFILGTYDRGRELVIDPVLEFSTFLGGSASEEAWAVDLDGSDRIYVTGTTSSTDFPGATNALSGASDVFVSRLSADGQTIDYTVYLGGTNDSTEVGRSLVVRGGFIYVAGSTDATDFPATTGGIIYQETNDGGIDAFVARISDDGSLDNPYITYLGGSGNDEALHVDVDADGNVYVGGETRSGDLFTAGELQYAYDNVFDPGAGDGVEGFVAKFAPSLGTNLPYATYLGGGDEDKVLALKVTASGTFFATGQTWSTNFPLTGGTPVQAANGGMIDTFLVKVSTNPVGESYGTYLGGADADIANDISLGAGGLVYLAGETSSIDFPLVDALSPGMNGSGDAFVTVIDLAAAPPLMTFSTLLGGSDDDRGTALAVDAAGNIYVGGDTKSLDFPVQVPLDVANTGGADGFVAKIENGTNALLWATYLGGAQDDKVRGLAVGPGERVIGAGGTSSADFPLSGAPDNVIEAGEWARDAFVFAINPSNTLQVLRPAGGNVLAAGNVYEIAWEADPALTSFKIFLSVDGGATWKLIGNAPGTDRHFFWTVPRYPANKTKCLVKVKGFTGAVVTYQDVSDRRFTIQVMRIDTPAAGDEVTGGFLETVYWSTNPTVRAVKKSMVYLSRNGGRYVWLATLAGNPGRCWWRVPMVASSQTNCRMKVVLKDSLNVTIGTAVSAAFTINPSAP